jgi:hypothetical protein
MFWLWRKLDDADRCRVWKYYGWFSGLMCLGCLTGLVSYAAWTQWLVAYHAADYSRQGIQIGSPDYHDAVSSYAAVSVARTAAACCVAFMPRLQALRWLSVYAVTYPFTFCGVAITKLLVIDRMMNFKLKDANASRWTFFGRALVGFVVVGNVICLVGNIVASVFFTKAAYSYDLVVTSNSSGARLVAIDFVSMGTKTASLQFGIETVTLLLIVVTVSVAGVIATRRIRTSLQSLQSFQLDKLSGLLNSPQAPAEAILLKDTSDRALATGRQMKRHVMGACCIIFISFLVRAVYTVVFSLVTALQINDFQCLGYINRCSDCYNVFSHILVWLLYTPEIGFVVTLVSQPCTLLVVLWWMTSGQTFAIMKSSRR